MTDKPEEKVRKGLALLIEGTLEICEDLTSSDNSIEKQVLSYKMELVEDYLKQAEIYNRVADIEMLRLKYNLLKSKIK